MYKSIEKFEEISLSVIKRLDKFTRDNSNVVISHQMLLGNKNFLANTLNKNFKFNVSGKDMFEIDLLLSVFLSDKYNLQKMLTLHTSDKVKESVSETRKYVEKNKQMLLLNGHDLIFIVNDKKKKEYIKNSYIIDSLCSHDYIKEGYIKFLGGEANNKEKIENLKKHSPNINIKNFDIYNPTDEMLGDDIYTDISIGLLNTPLEYIKELYEKHILNIKKLYKLSAARGLFFIRDSSSTYLNYNTELKVGGQKNDLKIYDWSILQSFKEDFKNNILVENKGGVNFSTFKLDSLASLLTLFDDKEHDEILSKINSEYIGPSYKQESFLEESLFMYNINKIDFKSLKYISANKNLLLYGQINGNKDYETIACKVIKKLIDNNSHLLLSIKDEELKKFAEFVKNTERNENNKEYFDFFEIHLGKLDKNKIEIKRNLVEDYISVNIFNDSSIFNYNLDGYRLQKMTEKFNKINNDVIEEISVIYKKDKIVLTVMFNEYQNNLKETVKEVSDLIIEAIKNQELSGKNENEDVRLLDNIKKIKRKIDIEKLLTEQNNIDNGDKIERIKKAKI